MISDRPLVSIVTPSFNQARYLEDTIRSVLDQDYPKLEYIVVDGASSDGSVDIIRKYASRLSWWVSEQDSGQAEAINKGLAHARGEIVAWLNSDDYYLPGTISAVEQAFKANPDAVLVYGDMLAVDEHGETINILRYNQLNLEDLLCFQIIGQPAVFFRREALEKAGNLDPTYHCMLDHHLWLRIALHGQILHVDQTWAAARYHSEAKNVANPVEFGREAFRVLDWTQRTQPEFAPALAKAGRRAPASVYRVNARYLLDGGQPWAALKAWTRALFLHPPTALARLNILVSALLQLSGFGGLRKIYLHRRKARFKER
jgi:glycosyltransferase involved in cell wall biosynthesis